MLWTKAATLCHSSLFRWSKSSIASTIGFGKQRNEATVMGCVKGFRLAFTETMDDSHLIEACNRRLTLSANALNENLRSCLGHFSRLRPEVNNKTKYFHQEKFPRSGELRAVSLIRRTAGFTPAVVSFSLVDMKSPITRSIRELSPSEPSNARLARQVAPSSHGGLTPLRSPLTTRHPSPATRPPPHTSRLSSLDPRLSPGGGEGIVISSGCETVF